MTPTLSNTGAPPMRAAWLMLGSTLSFGFMALAIRYATAYVPTQEVAFFRNAFGLVALLPMLLALAGVASARCFDGAVGVRMAVLVMWCPWSGWVSGARDLLRPPRPH